MSRHFTCSVMRSVLQVTRLQYLNALLASRAQNLPSSPESLDLQVIPGSQTRLLSDRTAAAAGEPGGTFCASTQKARARPGLAAGGHTPRLSLPCVLLSSSPFSPASLLARMAPSSVDQHALEYMSSAFPLEPVRVVDLGIVVEWE